MCTRALSIFNVWQETVWAVPRRMRERRSATPLHILLLDDRSSLLRAQILHSEALLCPRDAHVRRSEPYNVERDELQWRTGGCERVQALVPLLRKSRVVSEYLAELSPLIFFRAARERIGPHAEDEEGQSRERFQQF